MFSIFYLRKIGGRFFESHLFTKYRKCNQGSFSKIVHHFSKKKREGNLACLEAKEKNIDQPFEVHTPKFYSFMHHNLKKLYCPIHVLIKRSFKKNCTGLSDILKFGLSLIWITNTYTYRRYQPFLIAEYVIFQCR